MLNTKQTEVLIIIDADTFTISQAGKITGNIYLRVGNDYFPEIHWNDFAEIIITWWMEGLEKLLNGENKQEFLFMDGDFCFFISKTKSKKWSIQCAEQIPPLEFILQKSISISQFAQEILKAAKQISKICEERNWRLQETIIQNKVILELEKKLIITAFDK
jgi:hypothetical protein